MRQRQGMALAQLKLKTLNDNPYLQIIYYNRKTPSNKPVLHGHRKKQKIHQAK